MISLTDCNLFSRQLVRIVALALLYYSVGQLSLQLAIDPGYSTALWPASGIALAGLLLGGKRLWPGILLGSFAINLVISWDTSDEVTLIHASGLALGIGVGATLQTLMATALITRYVSITGGLLQSPEVIKLLALGGPCGCLVNATWGVTLLWLFGKISSSQYLFSWTNWWVGDTTGVLTVLPLALAFAGQPRGVWRKRAVFVAGSSLLTLSVVGILFSLANTHEQARILSRYERQALMIGDSLEKQFASYRDILRSIRSFFASSETVSREEFRRFTAHALAQTPSIQSLSWNPHIHFAQRRALQEKARRDGILNFRITEQDATKTLIPAAQRPEYVIVYYIEPRSSNANTLGFDMYSDSTRRLAMNLARDSGRAVTTAPIALVQEMGHPTGIQLILPVFEGSNVPLNRAQRRAQLLGYIVGTFRIGDILAAAVTDVSARGIEARLYDQTSADEDIPLAGYRLDTTGHSTVFSIDKNFSLQTELVWSKNYAIGTRIWQLVVTPTSDYLPAQPSWEVWGVLAVGLGFTGLLSSFLLILTGRSVLDQQRTQDLAQINRSLQLEMKQREHTEQALYHEKERAEITLHSIGDGVITTDALGNIEYLNSIAEKITEWTTAEAQGKSLLSVFRIIDEETRQPVLDPTVRCRHEGRIIGLASHTVLISRSGQEYAIQDSVAPIRDRDNNLLGMVVVFNDVSETRRMAREAAYHASHDLLTGLANRREFEQRLERALASSKQQGVQHALCYLDLDQFKIVNDTVGHRAGDELLKQISALLKTGLRNRDTLARLGGDEFALLLNNCPLQKALEIAELLVASVRNFTFVWQQRSFELGVSIGLAPVHGRLRTIEEALAQADVACYAAKDAGRNRVHVYQSDASGADPRHREIQRAADVQSAIERNRFRLFSQPIVSLAATPTTPHYEILLRMLDDEDNILAPNDFIPAAERYGVMSNIDRWVIRTVFRDLQKLFPGVPIPHLNINLSGNSLNDDNLLSFLQDQFAKHSIAPQHICFEITETAAIRNLHLATQFIHQVRELGSHFALDDFGTGLSSFGYLKNLPIDFLKLDGSFIRNIANDPKDLAIVEAIAHLAEKLHIQTIAEYVETPECHALLPKLGVNFAQGYAVGRPVALPHMHVTAFS
jgi:diguanylate cyclase (GGDEF)-like protein/PAS domain S-box-containing protein